MLDRNLIYKLQIAVPGGPVVLLDEPTTGWQLGIGNAVDAIARQMQHLPVGPTYPSAKAWQKPASLTLALHSDADIAASPTALNAPPPPSYVFAAPDPGREARAERRAVPSAPR